MNIPIQGEEQMISKFRLLNYKAETHQMLSIEANKEIKGPTFKWLINCISQIPKTYRFTCCILIISASIFTWIPLWTCISMWCAPLLIYFATQKPLFLLTSFATQQPFVYILLAFFFKFPLATLGAYFWLLNTHLPLDLPFAQDSFLEASFRILSHEHS